MDEGYFEMDGDIYADLEAAKAAAQADYAARILSAIEVAPSPRAQALEEAHSDLLNRLNDDIAQLERMAKQTKFAGSETGVRVKSPSVLLADLRDAAAAIRALSSQPVADGLPQDVINLVIAAREACDSWQLAECEYKKLDHALDAFSERIPYENEPDAIPTSPGASE